MLPLNRFETRSRPSQRGLLPWRIACHCLPSAAIWFSERSSSSSACAGGAALCAGVRLTPNTDLSRSRPCIAWPPTDSVGELFFGPAFSGATSGDPKLQRLRRLKPTQVVRDDPGQAVEHDIRRVGVVRR